MHHASGRIRFLLQAHEQVHRLAGIRATVEDIADDHEVRRTARPAEFRIDDPRIAQRCDQWLIGAVDIRHGDNALDAAVLPLARTCREHEQTCEGQREKSVQVSDHFSSRFVHGTSLVTSGPCGNLPVGLASRSAPAC